MDFVSIIYDVSEEKPHFSLREKWDRKLTYIPAHCVKCGIKIKNGTQMSRTTFPITGVPHTYLRLNKQRFV